MTAPALAIKKANLSRAYTHPVTGESVPSVTTVTGVRDKSGPLVGWAVKGTAAAAMSLIEEIVADAKQDPDAAVTTLLARYGTAKARSSIERDLKSARFAPLPGFHFTAAQIGDLVHDVIEQWIVNGDPAFSAHAQEILIRARCSERQAVTEIEPWLRQFENFCEEYTPQWTLTEATVWSRTHGYAGTLDLGGYINGKLFLIDVKTGNNVYPEYAMQLQGLRNADFVIDTSGEEIPLPQFDGGMRVLHLRPDHWESVTVQDRPSSWRAFLGLLAFLKEEVASSHTWLGTRIRGSAPETPNTTGDNET